jgi:hypothetical protein
MKSIIALILFGIFLGISPQQTIAQKKKSKQEKRDEAFKETIRLVESEQFIYVPDRAFPQGYRSIDLTSNYGFIKILGDKAEADMPFFGRGFQPNYGGNGGIKFDGEITNKKIELNEKKRMISYSFEVKDKDHFRINMEIGYSGGASVSVTSNNRSHISYQGDIAKLDEKEKE